jgi:hypothetical protein
MSYNVHFDTVICRNTQAFDTTADRSFLIVRWYDYGQTMSVVPDYALCISPGQQARDGNEQKLDNQWCRNDHEKRTDYGKQYMH